MTWQSGEASPSFDAPAPGHTVTYAWGDPDARLFGQVRLELSAAGDDGQVLVAGLGILMAGTEPVCVRAAGGVVGDLPASWDAIEAAGVRTRELAPLQAWDVRCASDDKASGCALRFVALSPPASAPAGGDGDGVGLGHEQLCRVTGLVTVAGASLAVGCLGQRGHAWGAPPGNQAAVTRSVSAWLADDLALSLTAVRPRRARSHADERIAARLFAPLDEDGSVATGAVLEARLSTTSDGEGRPRRAGVELFLDEDDAGHRAAGEILCGTTLDWGSGRLDCAFFAWRMDGHQGVGRYDVLRRAP